MSLGLNSFFFNSFFFSVVCASLFVPSRSQQPLLLILSIMDESDIHIHKPMRQKDHPVGKEEEEKSIETSWKPKAPPAAPTAEPEKNKQEEPKSGKDEPGRASFRPVIY
jgi:hypothetical protein